ncbi:MAG: transglutaminase family protein, partial [Lentisphaerae bacterium]|nr:transglutaminase family protein [Lentisphaerota bacterium]
MSRLLKTAAVVFWLVMMGWLIRYEAFPEWFARSLGGYRSLLADAPYFRDAWMQILFQGEPIGYCHTWMENDPESPFESYTMRNQTVMSLPILGQVQNVNVSVTAVLDTRYRLQRFSFSMPSHLYPVRLEGRRQEGERFNVEIETAAGKQTVPITLPDDVIVQSPFTEMALGKMKPGEEMRLRALDPASLSVSDVRVKALRRETLKQGGREQETTVLSCLVQGLEVLSWVDSVGQTLRVETPFGWTMQACSAGDIKTGTRSVDRTEDILTAMAVPCRGTIPSPRAIPEIELLLKPMPLTKESLRSDRQQADGDAAGMRIKAKAQPVPKRILSLSQAMKDNAPFLEATPFVQSRHPDLIRRAKDIVGDRTNAWESARAIFQWVHDNVEKNPAVSLPSALDVLRNLEGDCNEHTYLMVGLARAVGLPAQIVVGLVYN